ncbi:L-seryl-tRNA(Sec) selenium transferase [bacterium]|nr:L-seryl-tRNA(Sec) selenium transferase [bacterium]
MTKRDFRLPQIDKLLREPVLQQTIERLHIRRELASRHARLYVDQTRQDLTSGKIAEEPTLETMASAIANDLEQITQAGIRKILNGTGVILSTNLGRAPLPVSVVAQLSQALCSYSNLEFDLEEGGRGERTAQISRLLGLLIGSQSAIVVNNCASAVMLAVKALSDQKETIVSRGELIEIGGSFRLPDVITSSGGRLKEVGTTNRTRAADYEKAVSENTGMLMKCHRSNYQVLGFTEETSIKELAEIGSKHGVPVVYDLGGGCLIDLQQFDLVAEPTVQATLESGADLVLFSGDKLLGGPQAGIIAGNSEVVAKLRKSPIYRALRADKMVIALLESVLTQYIYVDGYKNLPVFQLAALKQDSLRQRAQIATTKLQDLQCLDVSPIDLESTMGGGSLPGELLPSAGLSIKVKKPNSSATNLSRLLRQGQPAVIGKVTDNRLCLDFRTITESDEDDLLCALRSADTALSNK